MGSIKDRNGMDLKEAEDIKKNLTSMQSTSCEMLGWIKHKLESRLPREISVTSATQITPPLWQKAKKN